MWFSIQAAVEPGAVACFFIHSSLDCLNEGLLVEKSFRRILVIKLRFHGDMLLTTPVISTLKRHYPDAKIDVLLYQDTMPILSEHSDIHMLYGMKNKKAPIREKIKNFLYLIKSLRSNKYDLVINLADQWMVALLVRMLNAPLSLSQGLAQSKNNFWRSSFTHLVPTQGDNVVESNLSVLAPLNLTPHVRRTTMSYQPTCWERVRSELNSANVSERYVVIQPTARQIFKCWDDDKFSQVVDALHDKGLDVVLTSGPARDDLESIAAIAKGCKTAPITALAGKLTFPELAALIDHAALFIGVDSAPGHIAAAVDTPLVCLFGATNHIFWRPWSDNMIQFWAGDYEPMPERAQLDRNKKYLSVIPAEDVIEGVETLLIRNHILSTEGVAL